MLSAQKASVWVLANDVDMEIGPRLQSETYLTEDLSGSHDPRCHGRRVLRATAVHPQEPSADGVCRPSKGILQPPEASWAVLPVFRQKQEVIFKGLPRASECIRRVCRHCVRLQGLQANVGQQSSGGAVCDPDPG